MNLKSLGLAALAAGLSMYHQNNQKGPDSSSHINLDKVPEIDFDELKNLVSSKGEIVYTGSLAMYPLVEPNMKVSKINPEALKALFSVPTGAFTVRFWRTPDNMPCSTLDTTYYKADCLKEIANNRSQNNSEIRDSFKYFDYSTSQEIFEKRYGANRSKAIEMCTSFQTCGHIISTEDDSLSFIPHSAPSPPVVPVNPKHIKPDQIIVHNSEKYKVLKNKDGVLLVRNSEGFHSIIENPDGILEEKEYVLLSRDKRTGTVIAVNANTTSDGVDRIHSHHSRLGVTTFELLSFLPRRVNNLLISMIKIVDRWIEKKNKEDNNRCNNREFAQLESNRV